ncbi:MAG: hypothetical protein OEM49_00560 [Myxococcales bacterium]|nr:hypothetical protein [Myxococcales bacterium]MDH5307237.1 hypothetical protein [Myxococcales bacterium]MDH5565610.1 hypothetical protein [Myxococcales bacterium]
MMRVGRFAGSLGFAVLAAAALAIAASLAPARSHAALASICSVAMAAAYVWAMAPNARRARIALAVASALGGVLLALPIGLALTACGAALIVALCRSTLLYRLRPLRALLLEATLFGAGLGFAGILTDHGADSPAAGAWGYFLVQSIFFLVGGVRERGGGEAERDPFDRARERLLALLDAP